MMKGVTEGRIVHYVLAAHDLPESHKHNAGCHRPAVIVNAWPGLNRNDGYSNLLVFVDGSNDVGSVDGRPQFILWATSRSFSEGKEPGTWHWIEQV